MPKTAFFISERYLKDNSPLGDNMDVKDIYPYARVAEDIYIHEALGTSLYEHLQDAIAGSPSSITANEITLVKICRDALVWLTCVKAIPFIWMKFRNVGLVKQSGENLETASIDEMKNLESSLLVNGMFYMNRLKDYLCENHSLYSQYDEGCWNCGDLGADGTKKNSTDLFFDRNTNTTDQDYINYYKKYIR
jgi:hypothetical protein